MRLGELLHGGELVLLEGQLGMGKTTFTQGLAQGMGITGTINSPTFTLLKEYPGRDHVLTASPTSPSSQKNIPDKMARHGRTRTQGPALYHFDLYRLEDPEEMFALGFEDYFSDPSGVCVVEWADRAAGLWPNERLDILFTTIRETERSIQFTASGSRSIALLQQLQKSAYAITGS
jgi:tRNA threonylcarbamoyladenosine biosynthesis protein TsaE